MKKKKSEAWKMSLFGHCPSSAQVHVLARISLKNYDLLMEEQFHSLHCTITKKQMYAHKEIEFKVNFNH